VSGSFTLESGTSNYKILLGVVWIFALVDFCLAKACENILHIDSFSCVVVSTEYPKKTVTVGRPVYGSFLFACHLCVSLSFSCLL
jgi:hypothetical protein